MGELWQAHPEGSPARDCREWTPVLVERRRGDLWTISGEAVPAGDRRNRRTGRCRERRHERSGGSCLRVLPHTQTARARVLEDEFRCASREANVRRAAGKPIPTTSLGQVPPSRGGAPAEEESGGDGARDDAFRKERVGDPEDPMNPIPDRLPRRAYESQDHPAARPSELKGSKPLFAEDYTCARATARIHRTRIENL